MEHLEGEPLDQMIAAEAPLDEEFVVEVARQAAHALADLHSQNLIHGDVKPGNILISRQGQSLRVQLADSGNRSPAHGAADQRADIYTLGAVVYEMLAGVAVTDTVAWERVPERFRPALSRALAPDPGDRQQSAEEFARELAGAAPPKPPPIPSLSSEPPSRWEWQAEWTIILILVILVSAVGYVWYQKSLEQPAPESAQTTEPPAPLAEPEVPVAPPKPAPAPKPSPAPPQPPAEVAEVAEQPEQPAAPPAKTPEIPQPAPVQATRENALLNPSALTEQAPDVYRVSWDTSRGNVVIEVNRAWAPLGADRFYNLVKNGFFDECRFFRVVPKFVAQIGIHPDPKISRVWVDARILDDPVTKTNAAGTLTFATSGPNTRTTQLFVNLRDNASLDDRGFAPFGAVVEGMDVILSIYSRYLEAPDQALIHAQGNRYLIRKFPKLDYIRRAAIKQ